MSWIAAIREHVVLSTNANKAIKRKTITAVRLRKS
jgi:hypothetical protein